MNGVPFANAGLPRFSVLGMGVHAVNMETMLDVIPSMIDKHGKGYVCVTGVHGVMESQRDHRLLAIHNRSFLTVPDGMPLVWIGRGQGHRDMDRVYGPDLMAAVCAKSVKQGWTHFLYGGKDGVAEELKKKLEQRFPGIHIVGTWCPPFRPLDGDEQRKLIQDVNGAKPDIMWIGLSTPKQERFMAEYLPRLDTKLMFGVGAAFDVLTGRMKDAPGWVKKIGMQWFHRLCQEPGRLGRRYFYIVPVFLVLISLQMLRVRGRRLEERQGSADSYH